MQRIHDGLYVSGQIGVADIPALQAAGIAQIICHRPDGESADQPDFADIAAAAGAMRTVHVPVAGGFPDEAVDATRQALASGLPTLMYCRSGMRSCVIWALIEARKGRAAAEIVGEAAQLGYDLMPLYGLLETQG